MRRLLSHAFSDAALREQEQLITHYLDLLIEKLHQQIVSTAQGKVNFVQWYNFTTFDILGDLCFDESFGALENGQYHSWVANIQKREDCASVQGVSSVSNSGQVRVHSTKVHPSGHQSCCRASSSYRSEN